MSGKLGRPISPEEASTMRLSGRDFAKLFHARRVGLGWTQRQAAKEIGVSHATITRWEKGRLDGTTLRVLNFLLGNSDSITDMWRQRAIIAEATIKDVLGATREYRELQAQLRGELIRSGRKSDGD